MNKFASICLFLTTGFTFTFRTVQVLTDNETMVVFTYVAASDGLVKTATYFKAHVAGIATTPEAA